MYFSAFWNESWYSKKNKMSNLLYFVMLKEILTKYLEIAILVCLIKKQSFSSSILVRIVQSWVFLKCNWITHWMHPTLCHSDIICVRNMASIKIKETKNYSTGATLFNACGLRTLGKLYACTGSNCFYMLLPSSNKIQNIVTEHLMDAYGMQFCCILFL